MKRRRIIYFNDARHYYLFMFEPPMNLYDVWRPVDEVAGTGVNTFVLGVAREDGLFYPTEVGRRFGAGIEEFETGIYWRIHDGGQSLLDRGLDSLRLLVDRAHDKGMEFFASVRMGSYRAFEPLDPEGPGVSAPMEAPGGLANPLLGGLGLADPKARQQQMAVFEELATKYPVEGLELDFAGWPGGSPPSLPPESASKYTSLMTDHVRNVADLVRSRAGDPGQIGARVYPTEEMCLKYGLDVRGWIEEGLVDYVTPMMYNYLQLDPDMPIDWLIDAARDSGASVCAMLQPFEDVGVTEGADVAYPPVETVRAAAANYWAKGADGLYAWFLNWPLGDKERSILGEIGDPDLLKEGAKRYVLPRRKQEAAELGYDQVLPLDIPRADPSKRYAIPFYIADDIEGSRERIRQVTLKVRISNVVSADRLTFLLHGRSIASERCTRDFGRYPRSVPSPHIIDQYHGQWLEFHLEEVLPRKGRNVLEVSLDSRPPKLGAGVAIDKLEISVEYGPYPSRL